MRVTPAASSDICWIETYYFLDEVDKRKKALVDSTLMVDIESSEARPTPPTPTVAPTVGSSGRVPTPSTIPTSTSQPPLTQAIMYQMGTLAHLTDLRASTLKIDILDMIS